MIIPGEMSGFTFDLSWNLQKRYCVKTMIINPDETMMNVMVLTGFYQGVFRRVFCTGGSATCFDKVLELIITPVPPCNNTTSYSS